MQVTIWYLITGGVLALMALSSTLLNRLPISASLLYVAVGVAIGPAGAGLLRVDLREHAEALERVCEVALLASLFSSGLKLRARLSDRIWQIPLRLATVSMLLTVGGVALAGVLLMGLSPGAALLLGAALAPTDPVLASDVQIREPTDRDRLRFGLTGEAGLNDGAALPFALLGLGLLGHHDLGAFGWRWLAVDVLYEAAAGLAGGYLVGSLLGRAVVYLRREHRQALGLEDFLTLGLIALTYGAASALHASGFLAVFAAGLSLRHIELRANAEKPPEAALVPTVGDVEAVATDAEQAPAFMAQSILGFNEQLEHLAEVVVVVIVGALLVPALPATPAAALWFIPLLLLGLRPLSVQLGLLGTRTSGTQRALISWFGIRGIGSAYYLVFAMNHGAEREAEQLAGLILVTVVTSIVVHGISVTPLMERYQARAGRARPA